MLASVVSEWQSKIGNSLEVNHCKFTHGNINLRISIVWVSKLRKIHDWMLKGRKIGNQNMIEFRRVSTPSFLLPPPIPSWLPPQPNLRPNPHPPPRLPITVFRLSPNPSTCPCLKSCRIVCEVPSFHFINMALLARLCAYLLLMAAKMVEGECDGLARLEECVRGEERLGWGVVFRPPAPPVVLRCKTKTLPFYNVMFGIYPCIVWFPNM